MPFSSSKRSPTTPFGPGAPGRRYLRLVTLALGLTVAVVVFSSAALIYGPSEHFWLTTVLLFGPTWLLQLPLAVALVLWALVHRGLLLGGLLIASQVLLQLAILNLNIPHSLSTSSSGPSVRVVTWNLGGQPLGLGAAREFFDRYEPDVLALQECSGLPDEAALPGMQRHVTHGMCLLTRLPLAVAEDRDRTDVWAASGSGAIVRYTFTPPWGTFTLTNVHLETAREGFEAFFDEGLAAGVATLNAKNRQRYLEAQLAWDWTHRGDAVPRLVAGDFNATPQSDLLRTAWSDYANCFEVVGLGYGHTKTTRLLGVRIDHVLASPHWTCVESRTLSGFPSDHRPVLTEVHLIGAEQVRTELATPTLQP